MKKLLSALLLLITFCINSFGAFTFAASTTNKVNHGSASSLDNLNTITVIAWVYPTTLNDTWIWSKTDPAFSIEKNFYVGATGHLHTEAVRATTFAQADSSDAVLTTNKWWMVAFTWDGSTAPKLYRADMTASVPIAEASSYSTSTAGSGAIGDDAAYDVTIGNNTTTTTTSFQGKIGTVMIFNRVLSIAEMQSLQYNPRNILGCVLLSHYGFNGTTNATDYSGSGNTGVITGVTVSDGLNFGNLFGN